MDREQERVRDANLVEAGLSGDRGALEQLVDHYYGPIYRAAYRILGDADSSADVTQATFLSAFENLQNFDPSYKFFSWIYRIAVNHALDQRRKRRLTDTEPEETADAEEAGPEQERAAQERGELVSRLIMDMQENLRVVIVLRHYSEFSYDDIAEVLDLPVRTVRSRLYSARQLLKSQLESNGFRYSD